MSSVVRPHVLIIGAGHVATATAATLAAVGRPVTMVSRSRTDVELINQLRQVPTAARRWQRSKHASKVHQSLPCITEKDSVASKKCDHTAVLRERAEKGDIADVPLTLLHAVYFGKNKRNSDKDSCASDPESNVQVGDSNDESIQLAKTNIPAAIVCTPLSGVVDAVDILFPPGIAPASNASFSSTTHSAQSKNNGETGEKNYNATQTTPPSSSPSSTETIGSLQASVAVATPPTSGNRRDFVPLIVMARGVDSHGRTAVELVHHRLRQAATAEAYGFVAREVVEVRGSSPSQEHQGQKVDEITTAPVAFSSTNRSLSLPPIVAAIVSMPLAVNEWMIGALVSLLENQGSTFTDDKKSQENADTSLTKIQQPSDPKHRAEAVRLAGMDGRIYQYNTQTQTEIIDRALSAYHRNLTIRDSQHAEFERAKCHKFNVEKQLYSAQRPNNKRMSADTKGQILFKGKKVAAWCCAAPSNMTFGARDCLNRVVDCFGPQWYTPRCSAPIPTYFNNSTSETDVVSKNDAPSGRNTSSQKNILDSLRREAKHGRQAVSKENQDGDCDLKPRADDSDEVDRMEAVTTLDLAADRKYQSLLIESKRSAYYYDSSDISSSILLQLTDACVIASAVGSGMLHASGCNSTLHTAAFYQNCLRDCQRLLSWRYAILHRPSGNHCPQAVERCHEQNLLPRVEVEVPTFMQAAFMAAVCDDSSDYYRLGRRAVELNDMKRAVDLMYGTRRAVDGANVIDNLNGLAAHTQFLQPSPGTVFCALGECASNMRRPADIAAFLSYPDTAAWMAEPPPQSIETASIVRAVQAENSKDELSEDIATLLQKSHW